MMRRRTRASKARRRIELLLLLAGVVALGIWGWSYVRMAVFQTWGNRVLDHHIASRPAIVPPPSATPQTAPLPIRNGALIGRLAIPRLNMRAVVREGAGQDTLDVALGHIPGTALPGQPGNAGIAGHRDTLFRGLRKIEKDDVIEFQTPSGSYNYQVESTDIVKPDNVAVLHAGLHSEMNMVTCYPFYYVGSAPDRFIVKARLVDPKPAAVQTADAKAPNAANVTADPKPPAPEPTHSRQAAAKTTASLARPALPAFQKIPFQVTESRSREVVPGIRLGLSWADASRHRASVWMYVTPERRSISLKNQPAHQAVFFHGHDDGKQRELMITQVTPSSITGYLLLYGARTHQARY
jgi:sortase A